MRLIGLLSWLLAVAAWAGSGARLEVLVFVEGAPWGGAPISADGETLGVTAADGSFVAVLAEGRRELRIGEGMRELRRELVLAEGDDVALIVTFRRDGSVEVLSETASGRAVLAESSEGTALPPGRLRGRILNAQDGRPVAGARVFIAGTRSI